MKTLLATILAVYVPIIVLASWATWVLLLRLVVPAWRDRRLNTDRYALGLGALFAMASHAWENTLYGIGRWSSELGFLLLDIRFALFGKLLILTGAVFTLSGVLGGRSMTRALLKLAALLWSVAFFLAAQKVW